MIQFWLPKTASWTFLGTFWGGPGPSNRNSGGSFLNVRFGFPSRPPFFTPTCLESVPKGGLLGVSWSFYVYKNWSKNALRGPYAAQRWVSIVSLPFVAAAGWTSTANVRGALCLLHAPCAISIANSKKNENIGDTNLKVDFFLGAAVSRERLQ